MQVATLPLVTIEIELVVMIGTAMAVIGITTTDYTHVGMTTTMTEAIAIPPTTDRITTAVPALIIPIGTTPTETTMTSRRVEETMGGLPRDRGIPTTALALALPILRNRTLTTRHLDPR